MDGNIEPEDVEIPQEIRDKWQNIVNILVKVLGVSSALIMKVNLPSFVVFQSADSPENPFKAGQAFILPAGVYCEKTMTIKDKLLIPNALKDPEWDKNPSINIGLISYLGFPIMLSNHKVFGTLCVLDKKENAYSRDLEDIMRQFKELIECHLELLWEKAVLLDFVKQQQAIEKQLKEKISLLEHRKTDH
jgi:GAF domain-containing protein